MDVEDSPDTSFARCGRRALVRRGTRLTRVCSAAARGYSRGAGDDDMRAEESAFEQQHNPQHQQEQEQERMRRQQQQQEYQGEPLVGSDGTVNEL